MQNALVRVIAISVLLAVGQHRLAGQEPAPSPSPTQQARMPHGRLEHELERLRQTLNVTNDQIAQIRPILETRDQQLKDLRANASLPQGEARAKAAQIRKSARRQVEHILTPEQRKMQKALRRGHETENGQ
jgi:Spy/CpxP family protein refolding chaperone